MNSSNHNVNNLFLLYDSQICTWLYPKVKKLYNINLFVSLYLFWHYVYHFQNYLACTSLTTLSDQQLNQPASEDAIYLMLPETVQVKYKSQQAIWFLD